MHNLKNRSAPCLKIKNYIKSFSANGLCFLVRGVNRCTQGGREKPFRAELRSNKLNQQIEKSQESNPGHNDGRPVWYGFSSSQAGIIPHCSQLQAVFLRDLYYTQSYFSYILITNFHPQFISLLSSLLLTLTYSSSRRIFLNYRDIFLVASC